jgi:hypothetical protein
VPYVEVSCGEAAGTRRRHDITLSSSVALTGVGITSHEPIAAFSTRGAASYG